MKGDLWLLLMVTKRQRFTKLCHLSTWPLLESSSIFKPCNEPDCSNRKQQSCSQVLLLSCKPNSTRNFWKTCTSLSLMTGVVTEKSGNAGKRKSAILTTYCFRPKNEKSNLRHNARNAGTRLQIETRQTRRDKAGPLYRERRRLKLLRLSLDSQLLLVLSDAARTKGTSAEAGALISFTAGLKTYSTPPWDTVKHKSHKQDQKTNQKTRNFFFFLSLPGWLLPPSLFAATTTGLLFWLGLAPVSV